MRFAVELSQKRSAIEKQKQIDALYSKARQLYSQGKIIAPSDNNALDFTRRLLTLSADHKEGAGLLQKIINLLAAKSGQAIDIGDLTTARAHLNQAVQLNKEYGMGQKSRLAALESQLAEKRSVIQVQQQADALYQQASRLYSQGLIIKPFGENALTYTQNVLKIYPGYTKGSQLLKEIVNSLADKSLQAIEALELEQAQAYLNNAVELNNQYGMGMDGQLSALDAKLSAKKRGACKAKAD